VIYNLWEDDEGKMELDFDTDPHVISLTKTFFNTVTFRTNRCK